MSPTPILDRHQPTAQQPRVKWLHWRWLALGGVIGLALPVVTRNTAYDVSGFDPLAGIAGFVGGFFCCVLLHELGHVAAGLLAAFEFRRVAAGPWVLTRKSRGYSLRFVPNRILGGGHTLMVPRSPDGLRRRF